MIVRRPAIDRARRARVFYRATLNSWLACMDCDVSRDLYSGALMSFCAALDALNPVERALFDAVKDKEYPIAVAANRMEMN